MAVSPVSGRFTGKDFLQNVAAPEVFGRLQMDTFRFATKWKFMCADEQQVVAFMEADDQAANGERYNQRYCQTFGFRDGKIAGVFEYFDSTLAQSALWDNRLAEPAHVRERPCFRSPRQVSFLAASRCPSFPQEDDVWIVLVYVGLDQLTSFECSCFVEHWQHGFKVFRT